MSPIGTRSTCRICGEPLNRSWIATWGVPFVYPNPLYLYCEAPLHIDCVSRWPHRVEFARGYFEMFKAHHRHAEAGPTMFESDDWMLATGSLGPHLQPGITPKLVEFVKQKLQQAGYTEDTNEPFGATVYLANWPLRLSTDWLKWDAFVQGGYQGDLAGDALEEANRVMEQVREYASDLTTLRVRLANYLARQN